MFYWKKLFQSKRQNQLYPNASEILQNIQARHNLIRIVTREDEIESKTILVEDLGDFKQNTNCNEDYSSEVMNISELIPENMVFMNDKTLVPEGLHNERTHDTLIERHKNSSFHIKGISINEDDAMCYGSDTDQSNEKRSKIEADQETVPTTWHQWIFDFVLPQSLEITCKINTSIENVNCGYFNRIMTKVGLDGKQKKTYSSICG